MTSIPQPGLLRAAAGQCTARVHDHGISLRPGVTALNRAAWLAQRSGCQ